MPVISNNIKTFIPNHKIALQRDERETISIGEDSKIDDMKKWSQSRKKGS